ncbi:unnamed protein product (plasmid) [Mycetohabitans rhizoxinica HKI 454]|uniref:Uncharacterized protein n=1 Tax=Mycetohabitans rhizoxinica (strain DSM 19002 / CIP 109453 / HKI 454) TaxID=882378 RepID=E5AVL1_MYCRK|nr:unnamed protein product [Mycetohabitans rhizoxinica HKI 454]
MAYLRFLHGIVLFAPLLTSMLLFFSGQIVRISTICPTSPRTAEAIF